MAHPPKDLPASQFIELDRKEARDLIDELSSDYDDLGDALDLAQADEEPSYRYVIIYVKPGEL